MPFFKKDISDISSMLYIKRNVEYKKGNLELAFIVREVHPGVREDFVNLYVLNIEY
jgi:hypothetical protein